MYQESGALWSNLIHLILLTGQQPRCLFTVITFRLIGKAPDYYYILLNRLVPLQRREMGLGGGGMEVVAFLQRRGRKLTEHMVAMWFQGCLRNAVQRVKAVA